VIIRPIASGDLPGAVLLMAELGYPTSEAMLAERIAVVSANPDDRVLIAADSERVLGLAAVHSFEMLHRPGRLGRITALVVSAAARRRGVGRALLAAAEAHLRALGCIKLEVTSNASRGGAHAFYASEGYEEQRVHFVKNRQSTSTP
jgi:GNAT superfamily N-acetyltransferase